MRREFCEKLSQSSFFAYGSAGEEETRERKLLVRFWKMFSWRMGVNLFFFFFLKSLLVSWMAPFQLGGSALPTCWNQSCSNIHIVFISSAFIWWNDTTGWHHGLRP